ncbi:MAG TPA: hypothetical protein VMT03_08785 [Polyangia bacterium]|nr:hypothetical protein [Polyangia bacterium]
MEEGETMEEGMGDPIDEGLSPEQFRAERHRAARAVVYGLAATGAMTLLMVVGLFRHGPAAFRPFPVEIVSRLLPHWSPLPLAIVTTLAHFGYGAAAAAAFSYLARPMSVGRGLAYALGLWIVMQVMFVPAFYSHHIEFGLGRGDPWSALFTLLLHAVYGGVLGWLGARDEQAHHASFDALDRLRVA